MRKRALFFFICFLGIALSSGVSHADHPKIFFSSNDIASLRAQAQTTHLEIWQPILDYANERVGLPPPEFPDNPNHDDFVNPGNSLLPIAFAFVITEDQQYLDLTRDYLLAFASWPYWGDANNFGDRDLGFHHMLFGNAVAYDWVYNELTSEERDSISASLIWRTGESYEAASSDFHAWNNWWRQSYAQNHWSTNISALGIASLVLEEDEILAEQWLEYAISEIEKDSYLLSGIKDGTWHEGHHYQSYKLMMSLPFYHNLKRLKNIDAIPDQYLQNYALWRAYNYLPGTDRPLFNFADLNPDWGWSTYAPYVILRFVAGQYNNSYAEWLASAVISNILWGRNADSHLVPYFVFEFFYYDPDVPPVSLSDLPIDRIFDDLGFVAWRTGWGTNDLVFGIKSSYYGGKFIADRFINSEYPFDTSGSEAHTGHDHPDANTFYFYRGGKDLSSEKSHYQEVVGTSYHNTILVDEEEQYKPNWFKKIYEDTEARIVKVITSPDINYLSADGTNMYREKLDDGWGSPGDWMIEGFIRYILFVKPSYVVMVDNIYDDVRHRYDWICHFAESANITVQGNWIKGDENDSQNNVLGIKCLSPTDFLYETGISSHPLDNNNEPYIRIRPSFDIDSVRFVNVLYPTTNSGWNNKPEIRLIGNTNKGAGIRVSINGETHHHLFNFGVVDEILIDEYKVKATIASVLRESDGTIQKIFIGNGTFVFDSYGNRLLVQSMSETELTFEAIYSGNSLALYGENLRYLQLYGPDIDCKNVTINGERVDVAISGDYVLIGIDDPPPCPPVGLQTIE